MRKDALPDQRLGWQFSAVDKLRAELPQDPRDHGGREPDRLGKANQPIANQFGAIAATAERIQIRTSAFS